MPVRKIGLCRRSVGGRVPRGGGRRGIDVESTLERDFVLLQRFDPAVADIEERPVRIPLFRLDGRAGHYVPDFLVTYRDPARPPRLVEVKHSDDPALLAGELEARLAAARAHASDRGWRFDLVTEREIRIPRLDAAKFLLPYRDRAVGPELRDRLLALAAKPRATVATLRDAAAADLMARAQILPDIWTLVARRELLADLDCPLSLATRLHPPTGGPPWPPA
ncbi:TnsA endonuclease N-terminal domain-containing protein [Rhodocista pekingensis]|uniref:TnsA endonuclease N-terminal domain-containing protein n=1 Tax=Rhodocista pekingensis TaxID=201185 RepID=A0ABW2KSZ5_9PROT